MVPFHRCGSSTFIFRTVWAFGRGFGHSDDLPGGVAQFGAHGAAALPPTGKASMRTVPVQRGVMNTPVVPVFIRSKWASGTSIKLTARYSPPKKVKSAIWG